MNDETEQPGPDQADARARLERYQRSIGMKPILIATTRSLVEIEEQKGKPFTVPSADDPNGGPDPAAESPGGPDHAQGGLG